MSNSLAYIYPRQLIEQLQSAIVKFGDSIPSFSPVTVRGYLYRRNGYTKLRSDGYEVDLEVNGIKLPTSGSELLVDVVGIPVVRVSRNGWFYASIDVTRINLVEQEAGDVALSDSLQSLIARKELQDLYVAVKTVIERKGFLRVGLVHGMQSKVYNDFHNAFKGACPGDFLDLVSFSRYETVLTKEQELNRALLEASEESDIVFLIRGGGAEEDLSKIGGVGTLHLIVETEVPFYLALGHTSDRNLSILEKVADQAFSTPSIAGQRLGEIIRQIVESKTIKEQLALKDRTIKELEERINSLTAGGYGSQRIGTKVPIVVIIVAFIIGLILGKLLF